MQVLIDFQDSLLLGIKEDFQRFLSEKINWKQRMIGIKGPRGAGKTTLMLQYLKFTLSKSNVNGLYVTADHPWFYKTTYWIQP
jgi:Type II secretory pathway, ATPase PulE/Tfp pilus assembly pathway, ATPase PilB